MTAFTKAAKTALAYCHITGNFPKHVRWDTLTVLYDQTDRNPAWPNSLGGVPCYLLKAEGLSAIAEHPLKMAHDYLFSKGFRTIRESYRETSHYVRYNHPETADTATAFRDGGVSIRPYRDKPPHPTFSVKHEEIVAALAQGSRA